MSYGSFLDDTSYEQANKFMSWIMDEFIHWPKPYLLLSQLEILTPMYRHTTFFHSLSLLLFIDPKICVYMRLDYVLKMC